MLYPLTFHPIYMERIWGGRSLERLFERVLPPTQRIGEAWEISDRPGAVSSIANGPLAGKSLRWLMEHQGEQLMGTTQAGACFPLLIKLLDASQNLSLQVHPPASIAAELGGEPKAELWYVAEARPGAELFVGLKLGVTRQEFERRLADGHVADCFHRVPVRAGDAMYLPSGRVHAIGSGIVLIEIQQNSDTTYRVFDWNRLDSNGKARELHVAKSLASIDFDDFEPSLVAGEFSGGPFGRRPLASNPSFTVEEWDLPAMVEIQIRDRQMCVIGLVAGTLTIESPRETVRLAAGQFSLIPARAPEVVMRTSVASRVLRTTLGSSENV